MKLTPQEELAVGALANCYAGARLAQAFNLSPWRGAAVQGLVMLWASDRAKKKKEIPAGARLLLLPGDLVVSSLRNGAAELPEGS